MKIPRPTVKGLLLTTAVPLILCSSQFWFAMPLQAAGSSSTVSSFTITGEPNDRTPEIYQGSFTETSIQQVLDDNHVAIAPEDKVFAFPDPKLGIGSQVKVFRASVATITDAGKTRSVRTWTKTVADLATEQDFQLAEQDLITPALSTAVPVDGNTLAIQITRVSEATLDISSPVPFSISYKDDPTLDQGTNVTTQAGKNGTLVKTYLVRRENGVEVSRKLLASKQAVAPVTQMIRRGTRPVITVRCKFNDIVLAASMANGIDPNALCYRMMAESNGHPDSSGAGGKYQGLFQYEPGFWASVSAKAGFAGASIWDATSQIKVTAWAWAHGYRGRWPTP